ncbi:MAG TPA: hypothetical protein VK518_13420 [Puia sp.]|nr:hypothetical protein [Puia sp.]
MRYQYLVILKKESERTTDLLSFLLCFISAMCFLYFAVRFQRFSGTTGSGVAYGINLSSQTFFLFLVAGIIIGGLIFNLVRRRRKQVRYRSFLLLAAVGWIGITPIPWIAAVFVILFFLEHQTKRPLEIGFDLDRIVINSLIRRRYAWTDLSNVVLKDGLLTLDFKNNKLLQKEVVDDEDEDDADEEEFNMYCRQRLSAAAATQSPA